MLFKKLNKLLKDRRKQYDLPQMTLAKAMGYSSPQFISNYERNLCSFPLSKLKIVLPMLNTTKEEVYEVLVEDFNEKIKSILK